jgi:hypothetical protein
VQCSESDPDDSNSSTTVSFTVTVQGADAQLDYLYQAVQGVGSGTSLSNKVAQAQSYLASGDFPDTCSTLGAFLNGVQAQSGKSIPAATASALIANAQQIQGVLACCPGTPSWTCQGCGYRLQADSLSLTAREHASPRPPARGWLLR